MWQRRQFIAGGLALTGLAAVPTRAISGTPGSDRGSRLATAQAALERHSGQIVHGDLVGIADFSLPSRLPRFFLVNLADGRETSFLVSHGSGSDPGHSGWLERFSNTPGSNASSAGAYVTASEYVGKHGRSMRLKGLEPSNSNAEQRAIVVHGAWYVSDALALERGKIGRSQGCFAFSEADLGTILARLGPGRLLISDRL